MTTYSDRSGEMVRAVLKMLFQVDTQELTPEIIENESERAELERLIALTGKRGK